MMEHKIGVRKACLLFPFLLALFLPLNAYVGPGAGFAFLSSFLVLFLTFFLALFSIFTWPFRLLFRVLRGQKAYKKSLIKKLIIIGLDGMEPTLVEKFMSEGKLQNLSRIKKQVLTHGSRQQPLPSPLSPGPLS